MRSRVTPLALVAALSATISCDRKAVETWLDQGAEQQQRSLYERKAYTEAVASLRAKAGGNSVQVLSLLVYPDNAVLQAQDPAHPEEVNQYVFSGGAVAGPEKVKLLGKGKLEDNLFPMDAVRVEVVPDLVRAARENVDMPEGKVVRVLLRRNLPESMDIQFRVFVTSQRRDAVITADKDGNVVN